MTRFAEKLDALHETASMLSGRDPGPLAAAIASTRGRRTLAVGSGGSAVASAFFARCRQTLLGEPTEAVSPMDIVVGNGDLNEATVWIFSAGADNPDTVASVLAAHARGAGHIELVTRNPAGVAVAALPQGATLHVLPVADPKDGFLATHSLVSTIGALLVAADVVSGDPVGDGVAELWIEAVKRLTSREARSKHAGAAAGLAKDHTVILAADPTAATVATLIETSIWEAALCSVQRTDLRNLAHGRHTWLHQRADASHLIGLIGLDSYQTWSRIVALTPEVIATTTLDVGDCGRFRNAIGTIEALGLIEAMGASVGIDPGQPGIGDFGRSMYADTSLLELARSLTPCVRQKRDAVAEHGDPTRTEDDLVAAYAAKRAAIEGSIIGAVVLDYDGTIVATDERFSPPRQAVLDELVRLHDAGVVLAIATGRGGSAGEALRDALPSTMHPDLIIGYYNGAHVVPLSDDIASAPPPPDPAIARVAELLKRHPQVTTECRWKDSGVQISIPSASLTDAESLVDAIISSPEVGQGLVRVTRSAHSIDIVRASASKLAVVAAARQRVSADKEVLTVGDSGRRGGNDCELLSRTHGISVGSVCGRHGGSHSLLGGGIDGPLALVNVLRCIYIDPNGQIRFEMKKLLIDTST